MSTISLRLPNSLHQEAREWAEREDISINQLIALALAEKLASERAADYLSRRAARGDRANFECALSQVPDAPPEERDRL